MLILTSTLALLVSLLLLATARWHGGLSNDSGSGVQRSHTSPTQRVGGIAVFVAAISGWSMAREDCQALLGWLLLAGSPAFAFGLAEDLSKQVSVQARLLATMSCGILGYFFTGYSITDVNVPGIDWLLGFGLISVAFTAFAVAGIANAINIIDGMNGLASGTVLIILGSFAWLSHLLGDPALVQTCLVLAAALLGFMVLNWPMGKIFLGDGGAYFLGFSVAWIAVLLLWRHPEVSAWSPLLMCGFPVLEVLLSIRRRWLRHRVIGAPDRLHLHCLVKRRLVRRLLPNSSRLIHNSVTGAIMWGASWLPAYISIRCYDNTIALTLGLALCTFIYSVIYARLVRFHWCLRCIFRRKHARAARVPT